MWIKYIKANQDTFKYIEFEKGFNVILADRDLESNEKDTRNGIGKTTLVHIINFCLGSNFTNGPLDKKELEDWSFSMVFNFKDAEYEITRLIVDPTRIYIKGEDLNHFPIKPEFDPKDGLYSYRNEVWTKVLGDLLYSIDATKKSQKNSPTFRSLFSYSARNDLAAFLDPFKYFRSQSACSVQVNNAFLLGLNYEYALQFQQMKEKEEKVKNLEKALGDEEVLADLVGSLGQLDSLRVVLEREVSELTEQLKNFNVHPQYKDIQKDLSSVSKQKDKLVNEEFSIKSLIARYRDSLENESVVQIDISNVYKEMGVHFADSLQVKLEELSGFHERVVSNRKDYLSKEIAQLEESLPTIKQNIGLLSEKKASLMRTLETHHALDEYNLMHERLGDKRSELDKIERKIDTLNRLDCLKDNLTIEKTELFKKAKEDKLERSKHIDNILAEFSDNSKHLYSKPGNLLINITKAGYKFDIDIDRSQSQGVSSMKVLCYDLVLHAIQEQIGIHGIPLIHDSTIFDGVDERQIAKALELAMTKSDKAGFQYICLLNSDMVPEADLSGSFKEIFNKSIRLRLSDKSQKDSLLGISF